MSEYNQWAAPAPGASSAPEPAPPPYVPEAGTSTFPRRPGVAGEVRAIVAATTAVAVLAGGIAFGVSRLASADGADSPEAAVRQFFDAITKQDMVGVLDALPPGERESLKEPLLELTTELKRLGVLSTTFELNSVSGLDFSIENLTLKTDDVRSDLAVVEIAVRRPARSDIDSKVPFGSLVAAFVFGGQRPTEYERRRSTSRMARVTMSTVLVMEPPVISTTARSDRTSSVLRVRFSMEKSRPETLFNSNVVDRTPRRFNSVVSSSSGSLTTRAPPAESVEDADHVLRGSCRRTGERRPRSCRPLGGREAADSKGDTTREHGHSRCRRDDRSHSPAAPGRLGNVRSRLGTYGAGAGSGADEDPELVQPTGCIRSLFRLPSRSGGDENRKSADQNKDASSQANPRRGSRVQFRGRKPLHLQLTAAAPTTRPTVAATRDR